MKHTLILLLFSCALFCCAPKHITKQTQITSVVTICNQFSGELSQAGIVAKPYLTIQNNIPKWRIIDYTLEFIVRGQLKIFSLSNDTLSQEAIHLFERVQKGSFLYVEEIKAVNKYKDTCYLPSIAIKIKDK